MRFKVLAGSHREGGRTYNKGDVVDSAQDLADIHGTDKFERLQDVFASAPAEATKVQKVGEEKPIPLSDEELQSFSEEEEVHDGVPEESERHDVTDEFDVAKENDFVVLCQSYKNRKWYYVTDSDGKQLSPEKGLTKKAVEPFILEYLEKEE